MKNSKLEEEQLKEEQAEKERQKVDHLDQLKEQEQQRMQVENEIL